MKATVDNTCVVAGGDVLRVDRIRLRHQVAELRERVAADAGNRRATTRVLVHEVVNHVAAESLLEIQHVVRNPQLVADATGVVDRVEAQHGRSGSSSP